LLPEVLEFLSSLPEERRVQLRVSFVYIEEAHSEEWPIGNQYRTDFESHLYAPPVKQSQSGLERSQRAKTWIQSRFVERFAPSLLKTIRVVADANALEIQTLLGAWPTGFYLFDSATQKLVYQVVPQDGMFKLNEWFQRIRAQSD
jgi:hypothetical protein